MNKNKIYFFTGTNNVLDILEDSQEFQNALNGEMSDSEAFEMAMSCILEYGMPTEFSLMVESVILTEDDEEKMEEAIDNSISAYEYNNDFKDDESFTSFVREIKAN